MSKANPPEIHVREINDPMPQILSEDLMSSNLTGRPGFFKGVLFPWNVIRMSPEEEENEQSQMDPVTSSALFETARVPFRRHLRAMMEAVLTKHAVQLTPGVDIGSGCTGEMVHQVLPLTRAQQWRWIECDVNPATVEIHRQRFPQAEMRQGSYLALRESLGLAEPMSLVTGLSSLDATDHLDRALLEIKAALATGGHLVHMQDVRPGVHHGLNEIVRQGDVSPHRAIVGGPQKPGFPPNPFGYMIKKEGRDLPVSTAEFFRQTLGRAIESTPGMKLLYNQWLMAEAKRGPADQVAQNFLGVMKFKPEETTTRSFAVLTVAQKIEP